MGEDHDSEHDDPITAVSGHPQQTTCGRVDQEEFLFQITGRPDLELLSFGEFGCVLGLGCGEVEEESPEDDIRFP